MIRFFSLIIFILTFFDTQKVFCKEFPLIHYGVEEGLPSNTVYDIFRDKEGFLWFATDKGVARFNGSVFENYTSADGLADNEIYYFQQDYQGRIWLGTGNGRLCFYKNGKFYNEVNTPFLKIPHTSINTMYISLEYDSSLTIYYHSREVFINVKKEKCSIFKLDKLNEQFERAGLKHIGKVASNRYEVIYEDKTVYIDTLCDILYLKTRSDLSRIRYHRFKQQEFFIQHQQVFNRNEKLFDWPTDLARLEAQFIYRMYYDSQFYFIGTSLGFFVNGRKQFLTNERVTCIAKDIDSNYWIATMDNGVFYLNKDFNNATIINYTNKKIVHYANSDKKYIYYCTKNNDLYRIDKSGGEKCLFDYKNYRSYESAYISSGNSIYNHTFFTGIQGDFFYIPILDAANPQVKKKSDALDVLNQILVDSNYVYVNSSTQSIHIFKIAKFENNYSLSPIENIINNSSYSRGAINGFVKNNLGEVWFSNNKAIYSISNQEILQAKQFGTRSFKNYQFLNNDLLGITYNNELIFCSDIHNNIKFDTITNYNSVWERIYPLDDQHLIVAANNLYYIISFDSINKKAQSFIIENSFVPNNAEYIHSDKYECYFFKQGKITGVKIKELLKRSEPPLINISAFKTPTHTFLTNEKITLDYASSRDIKISFESISFKSKNIILEYALVPKEGQGEGGNWTRIDNREINLFNLSYGKYIFKLRAKTLSSKFCTPKQIQFTIGKPYWATWGFISLSFIVFIIIIGSIIYLRVRQIIRKKEAEYRGEVLLLKSEYKSLNALMNPHFIFNTLNSVQRLINTSDKFAANKYMKILSNLIRQNMHNVSKELIPLQKEIELVDNYLELEKLRFKNKLNYNIDIADGVELEEIMIPPLLIQPLVENAVKHGILPSSLNENYIYIVISRQESMIKIEVIDNGVGLPKNSHKEVDHQSFALQNIRQRINQLTKLYGLEVSLDIFERYNEEGEILGVQSTIMIIDS
jgi:hypothetical protein